MARELLDRGHELTVVVPRWAKRPERVPDHPNLHFVEVRAVVPGLGLKRRLLNEALVSAQMLARVRTLPSVDVVLATVPALLTLPTGWLASRLLGRPFVLELRDAWPHLLDEIETWNHDGTTPRVPTHPRLVLASKVMKPLLWWLNTRAVATVVTSRALAEELRPRLRTPVFLARNTCAHHHEVAPRERDHAELRVLYLGSVGRAQQLSTAVRAALLVKQRGIPITLRIVGKGAQFTPLQRYVKRSGAPVQLRQPIPTEDVTAEYNWCDTVLVMLRGWDAMQLTVPSKLYEVMQTGCHISGSLAGEAAEILSSTGAGDVIPPEDPVALADLWCELFEDRNRLHVGEAGRDWLNAHARQSQQADAMEAALHHAHRVGYQRRRRSKRRG